MVEIPWDVVELAIVSHTGISGSILEKLVSYCVTTAIDMGKYSNKAQRKQLDEEEEFEDTFVLERETGEVNSDGTFSGPARFDSMPEDLDEQLKTFLKGVKRAKPDAIPDKRKRDEIRQAVMLKTLETLVSRYATTMHDDESLLKKDDLPHRSRMAIEVRLGEKKLLAEAMQAISSDGDVEMTLESEAGPSKRARRSS